MRSNIRGFVVTAMAVAALAAGAGCEGQPGFVAKEWSAAMRELQILPVFPPREDVRIGDMIVIPGESREAVEKLESRAEMPNRAAGYLPVPVLIARHDLGAELKAQYEQGPQFAQTPTAAPAQGTLYPAQPRRDGSFTAGESNRPRLCGMPEFMSATFSSGDLSALVPTEAVSIAAAAGFKQAKVAKLSVPFAEHYALPMTIVWKKVNGSESFKDLKPTLEALFRNTQPGPDGTVGYVRIVNEVFLARTIDVSVQGESSGGARVNLKPTISGVRGLDRREGGAAAPGEGESGETPSAGDEMEIELNPIVRANQLNEQLREANANQAVGGQFGFVSATASSIGMRRTFEFPQVIGYRGPLVRVVRETNNAYKLAGITPVQGRLTTDAIGDPTKVIPPPPPEPGDDN